MDNATRKRLPSFQANLQSVKNFFLKAHRGGYSVQPALVLKLRIVTLLYVIHVWQYAKTFV